MYCYDGANRLLKAGEGTAAISNFCLPTGDRGPIWNQWYVYDGRGNRALLASPATQQDSTRINSNLTPQTTAMNSVPFDTQNRILGGGYDLAGNTTGMSTQAMSYDAESRMLSWTDTGLNPTPLVSFTFDGLGRRVSQTVGTVGASGSTVTYSVYDPAGMLALESGGQSTVNSTRYLTVDHLGSVRLVTGSNGACVGAHDYLPFGEEIPASWSRTTVPCYGLTDTNWRFGGQQRDSETGLDNFLARHMSGPAGRFLSVDPGNAGADAGNPQSWNGYSYGWNNPLRFVDPTGRCTVVKGKYKEDGGEACPAQPSSSITLSGDEDYLAGFCAFCYHLTPPIGPTFERPAPTLLPTTSKQACVAPNLIQRVGIAAQSFVARGLNKTIGVGAGGSIGAGNIAGVSLSVSRQVVVTPNGQAAFATSVSTFTGQMFNSVTTAGWGGYGGLQFSFSNASSIGDLSGSGLDYGFGGGYGWGGGIDFSTDLQTWQSTLTVGGGYRGYAHGLTTVTTSIMPICRN